MPIRVNCKCGKTLNVKDELAGKAVKCPGCQSTLRIPSPGANPAARPAQQNPAVAPPQRPPAPVNDELGDMFAEEGFDREVAGVCPKCANELPAGGILCTKCGFNKQTGEVMQRHQTAGLDIDAGTMALMKAEKDIAHDKKVQAEMLGKSGMPRWMLALVLFMLVSGTGIAVVTMMAMNQVDGKGVSNPMGLFLLLCAVGFWMVTLGSQLMILVAAFKKDIVTGLLVWFVPFFIFYFAIKNWSEVGKLLIVGIICGFIAGGFFAGATAFGIAGAAAAGG